VIEYDVVVIGSGTGGYVAAIRAAQLGLKTAVVEKEKALGGTCLLLGCIPTKALLEHAHALKIAQHAKEWGITGVSSPSIDMGQVHARKDRIVSGLSKGVEFLFRKNKIDWIKGTARLEARGAGAGGAAGVEVEVHGLQGEKRALRPRKGIIVATGSAPRSVPGVEIDRRRIVTSDQAIHLAEIPESLVVLGAGAVGVEFASIFRRFGSDVTIIELLPRLVPQEDEAISAELEKSFRKQGITVHTGARVTAAKVVVGRAARGSDAGGSVERERVGSASLEGERVEIGVQLADGQTKTILADYLLVATGRGPMTTGLNAEGVGLQMERGYIRVDPQYRTSVPGISAVGDVITLGAPGHPQLAHLSSAEGIRAAERIAGREAPPINYDHVPACTYCDPEIGSVGLTEAEAKQRGFDVRVGSFPFGVLARSKIAGETDGFVKIVADKRYDEVLGVHMIGLRSTELVAEATMALMLESTVEELIRTIHAHPTMAEAVGEAAHAAHGAAIHL
jgi:dihydrolipoamide dehydrogenase